jgi:hypothetical protein
MTGEWNSLRDFIVHQPLHLFLYDRFSFLDFVVFYWEIKTVKKLNGFCLVSIRNWEILLDESILYLFFWLFIISSCNLNLEFLKNLKHRVRHWPG